MGEGRAEVTFAGATSFPNSEAVTPAKAGVSLEAGDVRPTVRSQLSLG